MTASDKFNSESRQKMKQMIELSSKENIEYFTIIKKDYTLGDITKGEKDYCHSKKLIESNRENIIGLFHTHPHDKDFFKYSKEQEEQLDLFSKIMGLSEELKEDARKKLQEDKAENSICMSQCDLRVSLGQGLFLECIGTTDKEGKPIAFCYELYSDAKERMIEKAKALNQSEIEIFLPVYKRWINNQKADNLADELLESMVLLISHEWTIKEKSEIFFD